MPEYRFSIQVYRVRYWQAPKMTTHYGQGSNSFSFTLCSHLAVIIHLCEHHDYFILIPCSPVPKLSRPLCSWLPSPHSWPRQKLLFFTLIQIIPRNTVTWSRNFRVFVTHTLSKSVLRLTLFDAELMICARRVHAAPPSAPLRITWHLEVFTESPTNWNGMCITASHFNRLKVSKAVSM